MARCEKHQIGPCRILRHQKTCSHHIKCANSISPT